MFDLMCFLAFVGASDIISSVLSIHYLTTLIALIDPYLYTSGEVVARRDTYLYTPGEVVATYLYTPGEVVATYLYTPGEVVARRDVLEADGSGVHLVDRLAVQRALYLHCLLSYTTNTSMLVYCERVLRDTVKSAYKVLIGTMKNCSL